MKTPKTKTKTKKPAGRKLLAFITRQEATQRFGFIDAGQLPKWKRRGWPLPKGFDVAVKIDGIVYERIPGERLHSDIWRRVSPMGGETQDGFVYEPHALTQKD